MGGLVTERIRPGVEFVPDAAAAFRRAEAQVIAEFGRPIDVNSTYRTWADQMRMFEDWSRYVAGNGPRPAHSKAVHPSESFHVSGLALDSDDWRVPRIVEILAANGFIRNRLHVPGELHHFEYIRARDTNYGKKVDDMSDKAEKQIQAIHDAIFRGGNSMPDGKRSIGASLANIAESVAPINRTGGPVSLRQEIADTKTKVYALEAAVTALASAQGADPAAILRAVEQGVKEAMRDVSITVDIE